MGRPSINPSGPLSGAERGRRFREKQRKQHEEARVAAKEAAARAERQRERMARLLDQITEAARTWAEAEYAAGVQGGRTGTGTAQVEARRSSAEQHFISLAAKLTA